MKVQHLVLVIIPLYLFLTPPNISICILRQVCVGAAFAVTISVNIAKTQKVVMIVSSKTMMSKSEVLKTKALEWFIIFLILLINAALHLTTLSSSPRRSSYLMWDTL